MFFCPLAIYIFYSIFITNATWMSLKDSKCLIKGHFHFFIITKIVNVCFVTAVICPCNLAATISVNFNAINQSMLSLVCFLGKCYLISFNVTTQAYKGFTCVQIDFLAFKIHSFKIT